MNLITVQPTMIATPMSLAVFTDPRFNYRPTEFHGSVMTVKIVAPNDLPPLRPPRQ